MTMTKNEFQRLVLASKDKLYRLSLSMLGNRDDAEDVLQDTFLKLWAMRDQLPAYNSVEALAVTVTKNLCIDRLRLYWNRNRSAELPAGEDRLSASEPNPDRAAELKESVATLRALFSTLPDQQKLIIHLRDVEQFSYEEIEQMTGLTINNIRVQLSRARKTVREAYQKHYQYE